MDLEIYEQRRPLSCLLIVKIEYCSLYIELKYLFRKSLKEMH